MDELIQSAGSLVGLAALVGVLVLFLLWWSMRRDRERLHRQLDGRGWQLGLRALVQGDGRPQTDEPREESVPEALQRVEEMKRRGLKGIADSTPGVTLTGKVRPLPPVQLNALR